VKIREATLGDARAIAEIHVRAWRAAYRGQVSDAYLDGLSVEDRERMWREGVARAEPTWRCWIAEEEGSPVGFCATGHSQDADADARTLEVYAIYLEPDRVGAGIGRDLLAHAVADLRERRFKAATLWVLETNEQIRRFYEKAGWTPDGATSTELLGDQNLRTVRYRIELS
jgi:GNAT superfamily N-acetyltransferase